MPTRIANYASQQILFSYMNNVNKRMQDLQMQITTEKRSQDYLGIGYDTQRLIGYEIDAGLLDNFKRNNDIEDVYLKSTEPAVEGVLATVENFRKVLTGFNTKNVTDENSIRSLQETALQSMKTMQSYLNTEVNGRHIFGGNRISTQPVDLGLSSLEAFQAKYDGINMHYPDTREKHLEEFNLSRDGNGQVNWLTFTQDADGNAATSGTSTITSTTDQFSNVTVGTLINVSGTTNNNGTYEVSAVSADGKTIDINTKMLTDENNVATATLTSTDGTLLNSTNFTDLTFNRAAGTIVAAAGSLTSFNVGDTITVGGTTQNDGTYVIESFTGTDTIKIRESKLEDEGTAGTPFLNFGPGNLALTQNASADDQISGAAGTFSSLKVGMKVTLGGTASDGTYTVSAISSDGSTIDVLENLATEAATGNETALVQEAPGTIEADTYYKGDHFTHTHRVSKTSEFTIDLNAADPAFEKAIRAMGLIAQGKFGTDGGLDHPDNQHFLTDAVNLVDLSLKSNLPSNPQYEDGYTNNIQFIITELGYQRTLISNANEDHITLSGFFNQRVSDLEDKDKLEAILSYLDDQRALEASYQAMASIRNLNLHNFL